MLNNGKANVKQKITIKAIKMFKDTRLKTKEDDTILVESETIEFVIKHNDIGVSIDTYDTDGNLKTESQFHFDDYEIQEEEEQ